MFYYNYKPDENDYNECVSKGVCSISPKISALQEVMFMMLTELAYYINKLQLLGAQNENIKFDVARYITYHATLYEYSENQVLEIINSLFSNLANTRNTYVQISKDHHSKTQKFKSNIKFENNMALNRLIAEGEKSFKVKYKHFNSNVQKYAEILFGVLKSLAHLVLELEDLGTLHEKALNEIIHALNIYNKKILDETQIRKVIFTISDLNAELMLQINRIKVEKFGTIKKTQVSHSTRKGKAIMVSGNNLLELQEVLKVTQNENIDIYTNGNLLVAHAYSNFAQYPNLKGHFGNGVETTVLDFATFPGVIVLTKNEAHNIEYLYRGKIFTTDEIPPKGVAKLKNGDLQSQLETAKATKGFTRGQKRTGATIGFDMPTITQKFDEIAQMLSEEKYKYLFIIGLSNHTKSQDDYFKNFFRNMPDKSFVISFSYASSCNNVYTIDVANDYSLATELLFKLFERVPITSPKVTLFLTKCDASAFAGMVRLNKRGAKNIYMSNCLPTVMNPTIVKAFRNFYNIKHMTTASADLEEIKT